MTQCSAIALARSQRAERQWLWLWSLPRRRQSPCLAQPICPPVLGCRMSRCRHHLYDAATLGLSKSVDAQLILILMLTLAHVLVDPFDLSRVRPVLFDCCNGHQRLTASIAALPATPTLGATVAATVPLHLDSLQRRILPRPSFCVPRLSCFCN
ncbi:hypothetical protein B0J13DRAFT_174606 [Dactylonectria estremocensis]|uniref:Uncharacterized protein n=1 Tax=Dactylonectria estremocensis TaxID=1079267 RepID=A0A9P9FBS9_9HYPO|nr:hypothetical protein B0J13DRAFT_174606 [Dactylonectria estremocensis]